MYDMTDSSSQSDDTTSGTGDGGFGCDGGNGGSTRRRGNSRRSGSQVVVRRRKGVLNAKERNLRRLESNERERKRMHDLNNQFQVHRDSFFLFFPPLSTIPVIAMTQIFK